MGLGPARSPMNRVRVASSYACLLISLGPRSFRWSSSKSHMAESASSRAFVFLPTLRSFLSSTRFMAWRSAAFRETPLRNACQLSFMRPGYFSRTARMKDGQRRSRSSMEALSYCCSSFLNSSFGSSVSVRGLSLSPPTGFFMEAASVCCLGAGARRERQHVFLRFAPLDERSDMRAPGVQRRTLFVGPAVALVDAGDASAASRDMVENRFGHFQPNAKLLEARSERAAKVVQGPTLRRAEGAGIETLLLGLLEQSPDDVLVEPRFALLHPANGPPRAEK